MLIIYSKILADGLTILVIMVHVGYLLGDTANLTKNKSCK